MRVSKCSNILPSVERGRPIVVKVDGRQVAAFEGETVAAVLLAEGLFGFRHTAKMQQPRGIFCGMGICYDCLVTVDGVPNVRACVTPTRQGMVVETHSEADYG